MGTRMSSLEVSPIRPTVMPRSFDSTLDIPDTDFFA